jgi:hypothetical protein
MVFCIRGVWVTEAPSVSSSTTWRQKQSTFEMSWLYTQWW